MIERRIGLEIPMTVLGEGAFKTAGATLRAFDRLEWFMLAVGSVLAGFACIGIAGALGIPSEPHFNGSLLLGGAPLAAIVVAVVAIIFSMLIGSLTAWFVEREAPLFCCCLGIAALGVRCGSVRPVMQYAASSSVFASMAVEAIILAAILIGGWIGLRLLLDGFLFKKDGNSIFIAPNELADAALGQKVGTLAVQMVVMAVVELIVIQTDAKAQAMAGVFIGAYLGSLAAYMFTPLPQGIWYWTGPMGVAIAGHVLAYFSGANSSATGDLHGWNAALARATPLDYAGMGTAGALLGYWSIRRWLQPVDEEESGPAVV
jgi:hypothetical protein